MNSQQLQSLRNMGNECEEAADTVDALRAELAQKDEILRQNSISTKQTPNGIVWAAPTVQPPCHPTRLPPPQVTPEMLQGLRDSEHLLARADKQLQSIKTQLAAPVSAEDARDAARYRYCRDVLYADDNGCDDWIIDAALAAKGAA